MVKKPMRKQITSSFLASTSLLAVSLLWAIPSDAGTPKHHPRVTPAPRMAVRAEPVAERAGIQRLNSGIATATGGLMMEMNGIDLRLHGVRVPTEAKIRPAQVQQHLASIINGKTLKCLTVGIDIDGVPLVACEAAGITNIALKMLQSGFADVDAKQVANTPVAALYTQTARMAKEQKLAIWSGRGTAPRATALSTTPPPVPAPKAALAQAINDGPIAPPEPPQDVVKAVDFAPIGLVDGQPAPATAPSAEATPTAGPTAGMSPWMMNRLGQDADPLGLDPAAVQHAPETPVLEQVPPAEAQPTESQIEEPSNTGAWILAAGLLMTLAAAGGSFVSWRRHKAMMAEIAWSQSRASVAAQRQSDRQQQKRQKAAINLEEDLLSLSQILSSRADIARLTATGPGGDTASDLRSMSFFAPDSITQPDKVAAYIGAENNRHLRKITNAVQELESRITQCADLAADGRLRDRPSSLFMALSQRMDAIAADARALTIALKIEAQNPSAETAPQGDAHDFWADHTAIAQDEYAPASGPRGTPKPPSARHMTKRAPLARTTTATNHDAAHWGQPDWATA